MLPAFPQVRRAYLFGSTVRRGAMRSDSDIDIAVEGVLSAEAYFALWRELEQAMPGRMVEVVGLDRDVHFAERVRQTGEVIYERADRTLKADITADLRAISEIYFCLYTTCIVPCLQTVWIGILKNIQA